MRTALIVIGCFAFAALPSAAHSECTWGIFPSPNVGGQDNALVSVAGSSPSNVWAVGQYAPDSNPNQTNTLALHFDGSSWSVVQSPSADTATSFLGVTTTGRRAWAVGYGLDPFFSKSLIAAWDGTSWALMPHPRTGVSDLLFSVAALNDHDVWAVGWTRTADTVFHTLVEHFDGSAWTVVETPDPGRYGNELYGVRAFASNDVWAVGQKLTGSAPDAALVLHWDGSCWQEVVSPGLSGAGTELLAVAGLSSSRLFAVGESQDYVESSRTFAVRSTGPRWSIQPSGNVGPGENHLVAVAVDSRGVPWAVGHSADADDKNAQTLVERNRGRDWEVVTSPNGTDDGNNMLGGIAAIGRDLWAVGSYDGANAVQTLILRCSQ